MNLGQPYTSLKTDADVIAFSASDTFAIKKVTLSNVAIDMVPGTVISADGSKLSDGTDSDFIISLDYVDAGANKTFRAVDRMVIVNPDGLVFDSANRDAVIAMITADGNIRVTTQTHLSIPTT
ncbi:hypothetical protein NG99_06570 [Erwinia typographi]|uniref:Uncharacterized protein n=1 Tax=Erwinia typographi TaxID=371042 RepID=A0A0A3Z7G5_9GAMM|nr:hypothetical protein [Erwinia typographi]KGT94810.1 hypothetical protein NG99_06570 [Erwinia typographi]